MANRAAFTEALLRDCRRLGPARLVLRNGVGLSEVFVDLEKIDLQEGWAHVVLPSTHVHLTPGALGAVAFRTVCGGNGHHAPAIWLYGSEGAPLVMIILDQTTGEAAKTQSSRYREIAREFGPFMYLVSEREKPRPETVAPMTGGSVQLQ
ncbi:MAG: hypothetical protein P8R42_12450 [Candidatus Binatia bacterium]|nr:hypothetical protein [Candidatus Binatia bacterium]